MKFKTPPEPTPPPAPVTDSDIKVEKTEQIVKSNLKFENIPWYDGVGVCEYDAEPPWEGGKCVTITGWNSAVSWGGWGGINLPISTLKQIVAEYDSTN